jgi:CheY-like chemotaxis protein
LARSFAVGTLDTEPTKGALPMGSLVALPHANPRTRGDINLLLAVEDAEFRALVASRARDVVGGLAVHEADDGVEAMRIALERPLQLALLDVDAPRLGGVEVAMTLRELRPQMRVALYADGVARHRDLIRELRVPVFDKLHAHRALDWLDEQAQACLEHPGLLQRRSLQCAVCGYGIVRAAPPEHCPMCHGEDTWVHTPRRPFVVS